MNQQQGFTPVQRTAKQPGDYEYIWRNRELVAVRIEQPRFTERCSKTAEMAR